jgi:hypothetical protein
MTRERWYAGWNDRAQNCQASPFDLFGCLQNARLSIFGKKKKYFEHLHLHFISSDTEIGKFGKI